VLHFAVQLLRGKLPGSQSAGSLDAGGDVHEEDGEASEDEARSIATADPTAVNIELTTKGKAGILARHNDNNIDAHRHPWQHIKRAPSATPATNAVITAVVLAVPLSVAAASAATAAKSGILLKAERAYTLICTEAYFDLEEWNAPAAASAAAEKVYGYNDAPKDGSNSSNNSSGGGDGGVDTSARDVMLVLHGERPYGRYPSRFDGKVRMAFARAVWKNKLRHDSEIIQELQDQVVALVRHRQINNAYKSRHTCARPFP
jgi:hypothetical protein